MTRRARPAAAGPPPVSGMHTTAGPAMLLAGDAARVALEAVVYYIRARKANGLPSSSALAAIARGLDAASGMPSRSRHNDIADAHPAHAGAVSPFPTVTVAEAALALGRSRRQVQRIAPQLGGRIIAGRWHLDADAVREHQEGQCA